MSIKDNIIGRIYDVLSDDSISAMIEHCVNGAPEGHKVKAAIDEVGKLASKLDVAIRALRVLDTAYQMELQIQNIQIDEPLEKLVIQIAAEKIKQESALHHKDIDASVDIATRQKALLNEYIYLNGPVLTHKIVIQHDTYDLLEINNEIMDKFSDHVPENLCTKVKGNEIACYVNVKSHEEVKKYLQAHGLKILAENSITEPLIGQAMSVTDALDVLAKYKEPEKLT